MIAIGSPDDERTLCCRLGCSMRGTGYFATL
jgi:hypothetical protein